jgi:hypothetical protein
MAFPPTSAFAALAERRSGDLFMIHRGQKVYLSASQLACGSITAFNPDSPDNFANPPLMRAGFAIINK